MSDPLSLIERIESERACERLVQSSSSGSARSR